MTQLSLLSIQFLKAEEISLRDENRVGRQVRPPHLHSTNLNHLRKGSYLIAYYAPITRKTKSEIHVRTQHPLVCVLHLVA